MELAWTKELPTEPGLYHRSNPPISQSARNWIVEIDGELKVLGVTGANPLCNPLLKDWAGHGRFWWFGPLPEPPWKVAAEAAGGE